MLGGKLRFDFRPLSGHLLRRRRLVHPPGVGQHESPGDDLFEQLGLKIGPALRAWFLRPRQPGHQPLDFAQVNRLVADRGHDASRYRRPRAGGGRDATASHVANKTPNALILPRKFHHGDTENTEDKINWEQLAA